MSDTLYHYCTLSTFVKIIESKTLRLSEIGKSNDYMELLWFKSRIIPEIIRQRFSEVHNGFPTTFQLKDNNANFTFNGAEDIIKMLEWFGEREGEDKIFEPFALACCFSEYGDLLSQWRGYADNAQEISMGIDKDKHV